MPSDVGPGPSNFFHLPNTSRSTYEPPPPGTLPAMGPGRGGPPGMMPPPRPMFMIPPGVQGAPPVMKPPHMAPIHYPSQDPQRFGSSKH